MIEGVEGNDFSQLLCPCKLGFVSEGQRHFLPDPGIMFQLEQRPLLSDSCSMD